MGLFLVLSAMAILAIITLGILSPLSKFFNGYYDDIMTFLIIILIISFFCIIFQGAT